MIKALKVFRIFGIDIQLHYSWWFVFVLLAWTLSTAFFPQFFPGLSQGLYWGLGIAATLCLFISVLLHELSHSLVARLKHIKVDSITLFFFGGVAGITKEDMKPSSEFLMAIAGPLFSLFLGGIFYLLYTLEITLILTALSFYLYQLNLILGIFNLVPGYPLDGGRAFRALLYGYYQDLPKATKIASTVGKIFAGILVFMGLLSFISGTGSGLWFIFLGGFLYFIAGMSYQQVLLKHALQPLKVKAVMEKKVLLVNPAMDFATFLKKYHPADKTLFVVQSKDFIGLLDLGALQKMNKELQERLTVKQLSLPLHDLRALQEDDSLYEAFQKMTSQGLDLLPVVHGANVVGVLSREQIMNRFMVESKFALSPALVSSSSSERRSTRQKHKKKH